MSSVARMPGRYTQPRCPHCRAAAGPDCPTVRRRKRQVRQALKRELGRVALGAQVGNAAEGALVDVSRLSLTDLRGVDDTALAHALRRILDEVDRSQGAVAGWQSAI